ncbi:hypothetical protein B0H15DRAFT_824673 [Mycena belliarum]|uniref:Uncharacterized protein n=1 Tax=Mycena belliarum TaxID=1033014 RepID=A0AAD6UFL0_9AGAR|nr:hypothetical protein B0H15DRAFT_824673 [Mycena belliae]
MPVNPVAENVLGTIGLIIWTVQIIPQIYKSWAERSTEGLSPWLVLLWGISEGMLGAYTVLRSINVPLILQPHLFGALALVSWGQCQYYGGQRSAWRASLMALGAMLLIGGAEAGIVFAVRPAYNAGSAAGERGVQFLGLFSSVLFVLGLLPQYVEVWRRREVVGISILFMTCDMLGGMFSDLSLVFKSEFDVIAGMSYTLVIVCPTIFTSPAVLR